MLTKIFAFGDSITHGASDNEMNGWVNRLTTDFIEGNKNGNENEIYNLGIDGDVAENIVNRLEFEIYQRIRGSKEMIFLFAVGINDSAYLRREEINFVPQEEFKENLQYIITLAKKYSERIVFIGLTPVDELRTVPTIWDDNMDYKNENIAQYNEIIKEVCERNNLFFIDILPEFLKTDYKNELLDEDGLHPNAKGHQKIFEIVRDFLAKNKII